MSTGLTVGEYIAFLLGTKSEDVSKLKAPFWPPDVFAIAAGLLQKSRGYCRVVGNWHDSSSSPVPGEKLWVAQLESASKLWRSAVTDRYVTEILRGAPIQKAAQVPEPVRGWWKDLIRSRDKFVSGIVDHPELCLTLLKLMACSDEVCKGVGLPENEGINQTERAGIPDVEQEQLGLLNLMCLTMLDDDEAEEGGATLGKMVDKSRARVLPKQHTPQSGLTIRSLSHYLCLCLTDEISPHWHLHPKQFESSINLLLIPWPDQIQPSQFRGKDLPGADIPALVEAYGLFEYDARVANNSEAGEKTERIYAAAKQVVDRIDGIVFPELALTPEEYTNVRDTVRGFAGPLLIAGVGSNSANGPANRVNLDLPFLNKQHLELNQSKHHRWKLERSQIVQYGLGSALHPSRSWWENIDLTDRRLQFIAMHPWLVLSVLICEDLARPDPVGDLIRSVGPNLVISLLMDGPQMEQRWPGRYATVLADDPGCSVLSFTSRGMARLSRPPKIAPSPNMIALWKDPISGSPIQIEMPEKASAVLLTLTRQLVEEWTADGRSDHRSGAYPVLTGVHPIYLKQD